MMETSLLHDSGIRSATIRPDGTVVVFDLLPHQAGAAGSVTAAESADWTEGDWRRLAQSRNRRLRRNQRARGLSGPRSHMNAEYLAQVQRQQRALLPTWSVERVSDAEVDVRFNGTLTETWYREQVPGMGLVWACYPAGHANPVGYTRSRPA